MYSIKNSAEVVSHENRRSLSRTHTATRRHRLEAPKSRRFCRTKILPVARPAGSDSSETTPSRLEDKRGPEEVTYRLDSFERTVEDACTSLLMALDAGEKRVEVEFPPLPASISGYKGASDDFIRANVQYALKAAKKVAATGMRVMLLFPDKAELDKSASMFQYVLEGEDGISMGYTGGGFLKLFGGALVEVPTGQETDEVDLFLVLNHSTTELPGMRKFIEEVAADRPAVLWNLELETLRADLGLFGFPPKALHYEFLSQFKSVYFLRLRDYSKSISTAPFLVNYSGALYRKYPSPWQVLLKREDERYVCVAEDRVRYTLFDVKEELLRALGLEEEEGSVMEFLRRGYKRATWWEEDFEKEESKNWRT